MHRLLIALISFLAINLCQAQITLNFPVERSVFQRDHDNFGYIAISGSVSQKVDSIHANFEQLNRTSDISTFIIQNQSAFGYFQDRVKVRAGWYRLHIKGYLAGEVLYENTVEKVGVGEVFIICGQSNAQGIRNFGARGAQDDRVNAVNYYNENLSMTPPDQLSISKITANSDIAPYGKSPWCWGELGDMIAEKYDVPVLFFNAAWQATFSSNWSDSRDEIPAFDILTFGTLPQGYPYHHLEMSQKYYASLFGVRAVLWHLGETDTNPGVPRPSEYYKYIKYTIEKSREDFGFNVPWMISEVSFSAGATSEIVLQDQRDLINTPGLNAFSGPYTDPVMQPRYDGTHFGNTATQSGLTDLAKAWFEKLDEDFFQKSSPIITDPLTELSISCEGDKLKLKAQNNQNIYKWNDGTTVISKTQKTGIVNAVVFDEKQNYKISNSLNLAALFGDEAAKITFEKDIFCEGDSLLVTAESNFENYLWGNGKTEKSFYITSAKTLSFKTFNAAGCQVAESKEKKFTQETIPAFAKTIDLQISNATFDSLSNSWQTCEGEVVEVSANGDWSVYNWNGVKGNQTFSLRENTDLVFSGKYSENCPNSFSQELNFKFIPKPATPQIGLNGILGINVLEPFDEEYEWLLNDLPLDIKSTYIKPTSSGIYTVVAFNKVNGFTCISGRSNEIDFTLLAENIPFIIYPNPTTEWIQIESAKENQNVNVQLYDATGKLVRIYQEKFWDGKIIGINVKSLSAGTYILVMNNGKNQISKKIIKN
jgi:hypothetical protein